MSEREAVVEVYQDASSEWRWRFRASNGKVLADSAEGYKEKGDLEHALALLRDAAAAVVVKEKVEEPEPPTPEKPKRSAAKKK